MARQIDERVVEMRFDNSDFMKKVKPTISSLEKLKQSLQLKGVGKEIDNVKESISDIKLDGLLSSVQALEKRFSTFGIVGMKVIGNIVDGLQNKLAAAVNFVTSSIVSGGIRRAMNIENAHFQLQALLKDETKVQAVMDNAMEAVDGTAYAYDEAAKAASQFAASGIEAGDEMLQALKGITGVAAMTNSDFESISQIFTTVAGNGRLMGDELLQLSSRGLNAASTIAKYFQEVRGQSGMTEAKIREMVTKGQLDFKTFSDAMTYAFGDSAKRANETFTGALSNIKAALARIGAGFISPLVEQNSAMVDLFNAIREQINNIKSALVFDEQKSAFSGMAKQVDLMAETIGKLTGEGTFEFTKFTSALLGTERSEDSLNKANERLSASYDKVKQNGKASFDTLTDFNKEGINASKSLQVFINGVLDGTIKASDAMKQYVTEITGGTELIAGDVTKLANDGKISYDLFTAAIINASGLIQKGNDVASESVNKLMTSIKEVGTASEADLKELYQNGLNASKAVRDYIEGVENGTINTSYALKTAISEITDENGHLNKSINDLAKDGKISYSLLQAAMEEAYGDQKALSKQFTDFFLDKLKSIVTFVKNIDFSTPMEIFYYWLESAKNIATPFLQILSRMGQAFSETFGNFSSDGILNFSKSLERLTSRLVISQKGGNNLKDAFKGVFDVVKLLVDIFGKLLHAIIPIYEPVESTGDSFLDLVGALGRSLSAFTEWIRQSEKVQSAITKVQLALHAISTTLTKFIRTVINFVKQMVSVEKAKKIWDGLVKTFEKIGKVCTPYVTKFTDGIKELGQNLLEMIPEGFKELIDKVVEGFKNLATEAQNLDFSSPAAALSSFKKLLEDVRSAIMGNEGIGTFVNNFVGYFETMRDSLTFDNLFSNLKSFQSKFSEFTDWVKKNVSPVFSDVSFGGIVAAAGGGGLIYALTKVAKAFSDGAAKLEAIPKVFSSLSDVLKEYQNKLKAEKLKEAAKAILILAGAMILLSFADTEKVMEAALALGALGGVLSIGTAKLLDAIGPLIQPKEKNPLDQFAGALDNFGKGIAKAVKWKAIGSTVKDIGETILLIAASVALLAYTYHKDAAAFDQAVDFVEKIGIAIAAFLAVFEFINNKMDRGAKNTMQASLGVLALAGALYLIVNSLNKLFAMELPLDYKKKLGILAGLFLGLMVVAKSVSKTNKVIGKDQTVAGGVKSSTILALAILLRTAVSALNKLFKMELPLDYKKKCAIMAGLFVGLAVVARAIGKASGDAKTALKAGGTILAMAIFMGVAVAALWALTKIDGERLNQAALVFGAVLLALSEAVKNASKGAEGTKGTWKTILSMAIMAGVIVAALGILSMVPFADLMKAAFSFGVVLLALSQAFKGIASIKNNKTTMDTIIAMIIAIVAIAGSLYALGKMDWKSLLAGAIGIKLVLEEFTQSASVLSSKKGLNAFKIMDFLFMFVALVPICIALAALGYVPWEGLLAGAVGIKLVLEAFVKALESISGMGKDSASWGTIIKFFVMTLLELIPITIALGILANQPWEGLLAAAVAIDLVLAAMTGVFAVCALIGDRAKDAIKGIGALSLVAIPLAEAVAALWVLTTYGDPTALIPAAIAIKMVMESMIEALAVCALVGLVAPEALAGLGVLDVVIADLAAVMAALGYLFNSPDTQALLSTGAEIMAKIGAAIGDFIGNLIGGAISSAMMQIAEDLPKLAEKLSEFSRKLIPFTTNIKKVDDDVVAAVKSLVSLILLITAADIIDGISSFFSFFTGTKSLKKFGSQLSEFIPFFVDFADKTKDIKGYNVKNCAEAMKTLFQAFGEIPNQGGVISLFTGDNKLTDTFIDNIELLGDAMVTFSDAANSIKKDNVTNGADSMVILFDALKQIPNDGGLIGRIVGNNPLTEDFIDNLLYLGRAMAGFTSHAMAVKKDPIIDTADAMVALFDALKEMPNDGGLLGRIIGENTLTATFVNNISKLGAALKEFSDYVVDVKKDKVIDASSALKHLFASLEEIPYDIDYTVFGAFCGALVSYGNNLATFYNSIKDIEFDQVNAGSASIRNLIGITERLSGLDNMYAIEDFAGMLSRIPENCLDGFITAFSDENVEKAGEALTNLLTALAEIIEEWYEKFYEYGIQTATYWLNGIKDTVPTAIEVATFFVNQVLLILLIAYAQFYLRGLTSAQYYLNGIRTEYPVAYSVGYQLANWALTGVKTVIPQFYTAGMQAGQGLANGMLASIPAIEAAAAKMAEAASKASSAALKINSPSKVFKAIGGSVGEGFVLGMVNWTNRVAEAAVRLGDVAAEKTTSSISTLSAVLTDGISTDVVISPTFDLSGVRNAADEVNRQFNQSVHAIALQAGTISATIDRAQIKEGVDIQNQPGDLKTGNSYTFIQNNTSPKALSRIDIYRQTKNQFSNFRREVGR